MLCKLLCLAKLNCGKQCFEYSFAQRKVCRDHTLYIFDAFLAFFRVGKVRLISNAPSVIVLYLTAVDDKIKLRVNDKITNVTSSPQSMQFITTRSFTLAVVLVALGAIRFLGVKL
jgi:hypothetical protein